MHTFIVGVCKESTKEIKPGKGSKLVEAPSYALAINQATRLFKPRKGECYYAKKLEKLSS